jgi:hypothetical protein
LVFLVVVWRYICRNCFKAKLKENRGFGEGTQGKIREGGKKKEETAEMKKREGG